MIIDLTEFLFVTVTYKRGTAGNIAFYKMAGDVFSRNFLP